jgi:hypothetical protein
MMSIGRSLAVAALLGLFAPSSQAADPLAAYKAARAGAPADVATYMDRRAGCMHWAGEEPYDADRRAQINGNLAKLKCGTIDADEVALRRKYASQPSALAAIDLAKSGEY